GTALFEGEFLSLNFGSALKSATTGAAPSPGRSGAAQFSLGRRAGPFVQRRVGSVLQSGCV
ncbi:MAG: hypothetical protein ABI877_17005, partial [Gemmatimonadaceae bacterium]